MEERREDSPTPCLSRVMVCDLDAARQIESSTVELDALLSPFRDGAPTSTTVLGRAVIEVHRSLITSGERSTTLVSDPMSDRHWFVEGEVVATDPWRSRVQVVETTPAIRADRTAFWSHFVHELRNLGFAGESLLARALDPESSTEETGALLAHVRVALNRMSVLASTATTYPPPSPGPTRIIEARQATAQAIERLRRSFDVAIDVPPELPSARIAVTDEERVVRALTDVLRAAVVRAGVGSQVALDLATAANRLVVWTITFAPTSGQPLDPRSFWAPFEGHRKNGAAFELSSARSTISEHGGEIDLSFGGGRACIELRIPLESG